MDPDTDQPQVLDTVPVAELLHGSWKPAAGQVQTVSGAYPPDCELTAVTHRILSAHFSLGLCSVYLIFPFDFLCLSDY